MRLLRLAAAAACLAIPSIASAQSACPSIAYGAVLTAAQWNGCFQAKQDTLGYTALNKGGDVMLGKLATLAPTTAIAGFRLNPGTAPTAPDDGDIWTTSTGLYVQISGATIGPINTGLPTSATAHYFLAGPTTGSPAQPTFRLMAASDLPGGTTGSGAVVLQTSPSLTSASLSSPTMTTPSLGVASATSINKVTITAPASGSTLTVANGKTLTASNTLTLTGADGSTIPFGTRTRQVLTSGSGTYTTPANVKYISVRMVGGGSGGGGSGTSPGPRGNGVATTFGSFTAASGLGSSGGVATGGSVNINGGAASGVSLVAPAPGGTGGSTPFGGAVGGAANSPGISAPPNSGGGGGGAGSNTVGTTGAGGGAGAYIEFIITSPSSTYSYSVGGGGNGGSAGTGGQQGGDGGSGIIIVDEFYQ